MEDRIRLEEDTIEEIKRIAEETGQSEEVLTARFVEIMEDLLANAPPHLLELERLINAANEEVEYKEAI